MQFSSIQDIELFLQVKKSSESGLFSNVRLLSIKSGFISYYSSIPKEFVGNSRSIQLSGQLPKYTISAEDVIQIDYEYPILNMKLSPKKLINKGVFEKLVTQTSVQGEVSEEEIDFQKQFGQPSQGPESQVLSWSFKCKQKDLAIAFVEQVKACSPQQQKKKGRQSLKPSFRIVLDAFKYAQNPQSKRPVSMIVSPSKLDQQNEEIKNRRVSDFPTHFSEQKKSETLQEAKLKLLRGSQTQQRGGPSSKSKLSITDNPFWRSQNNIGGRGHHKEADTIRKLSNISQRLGEQIQEQVRSRPSSIPKHESLQSSSKKEALDSFASSEELPSGNELSSPEKRLKESSMSKREIIQELHKTKQSVESMQSKLNSIIDKMDQHFGITRQEKVQKKEFRVNRKIVSMNVDLSAMQNDKATKSNYKNEQTNQIVPVGKGNSQIISQGQIEEKSSENSSGDFLENNASEIAIQSIQQREEEQPRSPRFGEKTSVFQQDKEKEGSQKAVQMDQFLEDMSKEISSIAPHADSKTNFESVEDNSDHLYQSRETETFENESISVNAMKKSHSVQNYTQLVEPLQSKLNENLPLSPPIVKQAQLNSDGQNSNCDEVTESAKSQSSQERNDKSLPTHNVKSQENQKLQQSKTEKNITSQQPSLANPIQSRQKGRLIRVSFKKQILSSKSKEKLRNNSPKTTHSALGLQKTITSEDIEQKNSTQKQKSRQKLQKESQRQKISLVQAKNNSLLKLVEIASISQKPEQLSNLYKDSAQRLSQKQNSKIPFELQKVQRQKQSSDSHQKNINQLQRGRKIKQPNNLSSKTKKQVEIDFQEKRKPSVDHRQTNYSKQPQKSAKIFPENTRVNVQPGSKEKVENSSNIPTKVTKTISRKRQTANDIDHHKNISKAIKFNRGFRVNFNSSFEIEKISTSKMSFKDKKPPEKQDQSQEVPASIQAELKHIRSLVPLKTAILESFAKNVDGDLEYFMRLNLIKYENLVDGLDGFKDEFFMWTDFANFSSLKLSDKGVIEYRPDSMTKLRRRYECSGLLQDKLRKLVRLKSTKMAPFIFMKYKNLQGFATNCYCEQDLTNLLDIKLSGELKLLFQSFNLDQTRLYRGLKLMMERCSGQIYLYLLEDSNDYLSQFLASLTRKQPQKQQTPSQQSFPSSFAVIDSVYKLSDVKQTFTSVCQYMQRAHIRHPRIDSERVVLMLDKLNKKFPENQPLITHFVTRLLNISTVRLSKLTADFPEELSLQKSQESELLMDQISFEPTIEISTKTKMLSENQKRFFKYIENHSIEQASRSLDWHILQISEERKIVSSSDCLYLLTKMLLFLTLNSEIQRALQFCKRLILGCFEFNIERIRFLKMLLQISCIANVDIGVSLRSLYRKICLRFFGLENIVWIQFFLVQIHALEVSEQNICFIESCYKEAMQILQKQTHGTKAIQDLIVKLHIETIGYFLKNDFHRQAQSYSNELQKYRKTIKLEHSQSDWVLQMFQTKIELSEISEINSVHQKAYFQRVQTIVRKSIKSKRESYVQMALQILLLFWRSSKNLSESQVITLMSEIAQESTNPFFGADAIRPKIVNFLEEQVSLQNRDNYLGQFESLNKYFSEAYQAVISE